MKPDFCQDRADWLVDAVACSTQNRMFLRGDEEADRVVIEALYLNGLMALRAAYAAGLDHAATICDRRYMGDNNREDMEARRCAEAIRAEKEKTNG